MQSIFDQSGFLISALSLITIAVTDFKNRQVLNINLILLVIGLSIHIHIHNWKIKLISVIVAGLIQIVINLIFKKDDNNVIQAGDMKLILILIYFLDIQNLSLIIIVSSTLGLVLFLRGKVNDGHVPLAGIISSITLAFLCFMSP